MDSHTTSTLAYRGTRTTDTPDATLDGSARHVAVVGGGIAGLTAAVYLARAGVRVTVFERAARAGGLAATDVRDGYAVNRGIHALYTGGAFSDVLADLGIGYSYGVPTAVFVLDGQRLQPLPAAPLALLRTGALGVRDKLALVRLLAAVPRVDAATLARTSVAAWLDDVAPRRVRRLLTALARTFVYSAALDLVSAEVVVAKLQASLRHPIHYVDGGWQTLVDGLRRAAERAGARIVTGARVDGVAWRDGRVAGVRLDDGTHVAVDAAIVAAAPHDAARLIDGAPSPAGDELRAVVASLVPAQVACLDVALRRLPDPRHPVVQDLDRPRFCTAQSRYARVAPAGGALVHAFKQLDPRRPTDAREDERDLEGLLDRVQPGWRDLVVRRVTLPRIAAVGALPLAAAGGFTGRPGAQVPGLANLFLAGDWVGPEGFLADASAASARTAARLAASAAGLAGMATAATAGAAPRPAAAAA